MVCENSFSVLHIQSLKRYPFLDSFDQWHVDIGIEACRIVFSVRILYILEGIGYDDSISVVEQSLSTMIRPVYAGG